MTRVERNDTVSLCLMEGNKVPDQDPDQNRPLSHCSNTGPLTNFPSLRYVLEKVDLVIVGAEGVVESGGIINKVRFQAEHAAVAL